MKRNMDSDHKSWNFNILFIKTMKILEFKIVFIQILDF